MMRLLASCIPNAPPIAVVLTSHGTFFDINRSLQSEVFPGIASNIHYIVGYDTLIRIYDPKYYKADLQSLLDEFYTTAHLLCADRPHEGSGISLVELVDSVIEHKDRVRLLSNWSSQDEASFSISSSLVRQTVSNRGDYSPLVPSSIYAYIESTSLYR